VSEADWILSDSQSQKVKLIDGRFIDNVPREKLIALGKSMGRPMDHEANVEAFANEVRLMYLTFLNGEMNTGVIVPTALDQLVFHGRNPVGSKMGEFLRAISMYKPFNLALLFEHLGPQYKQLFTGSGGGRTQAMMFLGYMLVMGVLLALLKDLLALRKPRMPWTRSGAWAAIGRSGVISYADQLFGREWSLPGDNSSLVNGIMKAAEFGLGPASQPLFNFGDAINKASNGKAIASNKAFVQAMANSLPGNDIPLASTLIHRLAVEGYMRGVDPKRAANQQAFLEFNASGSWNPYDLLNQSQ